MINLSGRIGSCTATLGALLVTAGVTGVGLQETKLLANNGNLDDWFGESVAISGKTTIVGAFADDDNGFSGSAYLFDTSTNSQIAKLLPSR